MSPLLFPSSSRQRVNDVLLQFRSGLICEGEGNDILGLEAGLQQIRDAARDDFGLSRAGAGDELQVRMSVLNRSDLGFGELHRLPSLSWDRPKQLMVFK